MNTKRKSRANTNSTGTRAPRARASSSGGNGVNAQVSGADGIYLNETFMHRVTSLIGLEVEIVTHSKEMYSGILRTFSSNFDVVLELPHRTDPPPSSQAIGLKIVADKMIFKFDSIVKIAAYETDLDSMTRNTFQTDTTISKYNGQPSGEKVLEMWEPPSMNGDMDDFDLSSGNNNANGWDADDMFRRNEQEHGVTSSFDQNLSGYTTEIRTDLSNFKNEEAKAARLAREIESNPSSQNRANLENGDEEERFAAVSRPASEMSNNHNDNKYMSGRRKPGPQQPANSAYGLFNRNRKHPEKYPSSGSNERWECVSGSGTKNSNQNRGHAHQQNGNNNVVNKSTLPPYHNSANQTYAANSRESPVSVNGQSDKRTSAPINNRRETSSSGSRHVSGRNNYSSNDNQSLPSSSRSSPPTVQGHHNQIASVPPPRYQTATYTQQTSTTNSRPNVSTSYAAAADKSVPKTQPPPPIRVRDESLNSELKRFSTDFNLSSPSPQNNPRVSSPASVVSETPKQHAAQIPHSEPPSPSVQEVSHVPEEVTESPVSPPQTLYKLQEVQIEKNVENLKKDQTEKTPEENITQLPDKTVVQTSKLNPNAKEFVFNPNTKPFIPRSPSTPNSSRPMTPQTPTTNIVATTNQHQQMIQAQHGPAIAIPAAYHHHHHQHAPGTGQMVTHQAPPHPHPAFTMLPTVFVTSNSAFNHHPHSMPPQPPNQAGRFRKMTVGMSHRSDIASQIQVAAATGQPLLAPAPLQAQFAVPGYSPQPMPTPQAYQQVQMVRMVPQQGGGMMPTLVPTSIAYHPANAGQLSQMESGVPQGPPSYHHHHHHQASQHHIMNQQQTAQSPAPQPGPPQTPGQSQTPVNFQQPPPQQSQPPPFPAGTTIMCPILPTPTASQQPSAPNTPGSAPPMQQPPPQQHQQYISHPHQHHQAASTQAPHGQYHLYSTIRES
ncbi:ataxin-2 homolog isoform X1 [Rhopalosiphum padi]|nr:ataxin-2 homolog isoform X1 [Rhopalosiphum padi]